MAQAGYTPISLYYSTTAAASPAAGDLVAGELALNTNDEKLYFKNSAGTVKLLASTASTLNVSSITFGSTGLTPSTATTGAVTVGGTLATTNGGTGSTSTTYCSLTTNVTGTLPIANGGTGQTTATAAFDALNPMTTLGDMIYEGAGPTAIRLPIGSTSQILTVVGGVPAWASPAAGGVTTISFGSTGLTPSTATSGAVSVAGTLAIANGGTGSTSTTYCSLTSNVTGTLPVANGGTGATTFTTNSVVLGNGTSALNANLVAPGTAGNVLTSNGSTWTSAAAGGGQLQTELFTAPGTWTKPSSCTLVRVTVIGGGGGGGINNATSGGTGGTSSFGSAVSATGGGGGSYGNPSGSFGANGSGTVSSGTALKTGSVFNSMPPADISGTSYFAQLMGQPFGFISSGGTTRPQTSPGAGVAYATSGTLMAGAAGFSSSGASNTSGKGGCGGLAMASNVPVSAPVTVTVGSGGNTAGANPGVSRSVGGVVLVEYVG
jgi:hypothetical protein